MSECSLGFLVVVALVGVFLCLVVVWLWVAGATENAENSYLRQYNSDQSYENGILQRDFEESQRQLKGAKAEIKWLAGSNQEVK